MKKILSAVLLLACICMLFACGSPTSSFENALASNDFTKATITQVTEDQLGSLTGTYTVTYNEDGSATIEYSYEQWTDINNASATELKTVKTGTITRGADGKYTDGKDFSGSADEIPAGFQLNLESVKEDAKISSDKTTLTVDVSADATADVLGVEFPHDVTIEVVLKDKALDTVKVSFTTTDKTGEEYNHSITCKYE
ncbi:MAG: hypothetical protein IJY01_06290 [Clostridia bacterium]|nr:hypothetical protein [Clostridia bacterium]